MSQPLPPKERQGRRGSETCGPSQLGQAIRLVCVSEIAPVRKLRASYQGAEFWTCEKKDSTDPFDVPSAGSAELYNEPFTHYNLPFIQSYETIGKLVRSLSATNHALAELKAQLPQRNQQVIKIQEMYLYLSGRHFSSASPRYTLMFLPV